MEENKLGFTGLWIPREFIEDERLTWTQRILIATIHALDAGNDFNGCYASNDYLAIKCDVSAKSLPVILSRLRELGYIEDRGFDGRKRLMSVKGSIKPRLNPDINHSLTQTLTTVKPYIIDHKKVDNTDKKTPTPLEVDGLPFKSEAFSNAWNEFKEHRAGLKKKVTPLAAKKLLKVCEKLGETESIKAIDESIANGWQGIFERKTLGGKQPSTGDARDRQLLRENIVVRRIDCMKEGF